jgi:hypothetical protein
VTVKIAVGMVDEASGGARLVKREICPIGLRHCQLLLVRVDASKEERS